MAYSLYLWHWPLLALDRASRLAGLIATPLLLLAAMAYTGFNPLLLADGDTAGTLWRFVADFFPPSRDGAFLHDLLRETATTLAIASSGLALAVLLGLPLALLTSRALDRDRLCGDAPARGWQWLQRLLRGVLIVLRGVPDLVWALLLVRAAGLGSLPAVLALGLAYGGMLGKVYAEILESGETHATDTLLRNGSGRLQAFFYGLLPASAAELTSYTVYRWECAIRSSVVLGFVGAGGLGQQLDNSMKMFNGGEVASMLLVFIALVALADRVSAWLRKSLG